MAYVTAITDRVLSDITTPTSKGYWNIADWTRVYGNSQLVNSLAAIMLDTPIVFNTLTAPTITTIPSVTDFNTFLANIERLRLAVAGESIVGTGTEIKDDYTAGTGYESPDYVDANLWESTLDAIWNHYNGPTLDECPILSTDLTILTGAQEIYIDCLDMADYNADLQGTANLYII